MSDRFTVTYPSDQEVSSVEETPNSSVETNPEIPTNGTENVESKDIEHLQTDCELAVKEPSSLETSSADLTVQETGLVRVESAVEFPEEAKELQVESDGIKRESDPPVEDSSPVETSNGEQVIVEAPIEGPSAGSEEETNAETPKDEVVREESNVVELTETVSVDLPVVVTSTPPAETLNSEQVESGEEIRNIEVESNIAIHLETYPAESSIEESSTLTVKENSNSEIPSEPEKQTMTISVSRNQILLSTVIEQPDLSCRKSEISSGLDWLIEVDKLLINQHFTKYQIFPSTGPINKYCIKTISGSKSLEAVEISKFWHRILWAQNRPFQLNVFDDATEVLRYNRSFACCFCLCTFRVQRMTVTYPDGTLIGTVEQKHTYLVPKFLLKDASGDIVLVVKGPKLAIGFGRNVDFQVMTTEGQNVGTITKLWGGFTREAFTDVDNFKLAFPADINVHTKAILLGACFLIDFMYFEMLGNSK